MITFQGINGSLSQTQFRFYAVSSREFVNEVALKKFSENEEDHQLNSSVIGEQP